MDFVQRDNLKCTLLHSIQLILGNYIGLGTDEILFYSSQFQTLEFNKCLHLDFIFFFGFLNKFSNES